MFGFCIKVYGCQMNVYDGDKIRTAMILKGWREVPEIDADVVVYVGCSIREKAEHKIWSEMGRYRPAWEGKKSPIVCLVGCMAQNVGRDMMKRFPWIRMIAGPRSIGFIPDGLIRAVSGERVDLLDADAREFNDLDVVPIKRDNPWKAYVTIAHGCDYFCTYCIVPYVRGRFMSRDSGEILEEIRALVDDGVREISLLGQNVDTYGADFDRPYRFADLLRDVAETDGVDLIRFMTSYPKDLTADVVSVMAEYPKICPGINLPIQSGSDRILKSMNRHYSLAEYTETVRIIREGLPEVGLTSDLIVGFPGETEEDFMASMEAVRRFRFDLVHTAAYSPRAGTPAAKMEDQLPEEEKFRRLSEINRLQSSIAMEINEATVGRRYRILIDGPAPKGDGLVQGRTMTDKVVICPGEASWAGRFAEVEIVRAENWCLHGEISEVEGLS
ncbi:MULTISPECIES: tRNA (N6-isopentenyl adenosine(37)-C2)-methylthiotransferase MiaB [Dethiosulfovibrio]|uniref:tRNA-2-methylthio-N(6)-dimethylallyladenosine synthase n=2 Tax=Dethiosulfovibrio TaxID=47054 RepID=A0ABS9EMP8_9BACT|nr:MULTISPECIES: tRNA (N6-isopentenyl adenosine(37)-C2)-methylthiotransferase MiaB [Dethiosulfovibrio]MCF4113781.1 tRNA (N6-isopentenyl adenosine(37)-C2)-methylthiotransferase MiaB [Dethiosulfovibrio russensis]MCF4141806.1 tRNA (N6-isopentenyl adenosine(37)-C2)-methylthiotransferase MiaB [Dethiosulfovibrio marinus]MCF4143776.1 tRNA (N6-isopentenyl adenosine(37)-C2)-methylthiotransferase MiaB [Dethiosulfovibrio acidaminovorans]MEA3285304.1 tRNA (N6-isopentenyl adenosine(37)-C2)-methylthiotransfe